MNNSDYSGIQAHLTLHGLANLSSSLKRQGLSIYNLGPSPSTQLKIQKGESVRAKCIASVWLQLFNRGPHDSEWILEHVKSTNVLVRNATEQDLPWMAEVEQGQFASDGVPVQKLRQWFRANPNGFFVVEDGQQRLGQLNLLPVIRTPDKFGRFIDGMASEMDIDRDWIVPDSEKDTVRHLYVESMIVQEVKRSDRKASMLSAVTQIFERLGQICDLRYARSTAIYAMEATGLGKTLIEALIFQKIAESGGHCIYVIMLDTLLDQVGTHYGGDALISRKKYSIVSSVKLAGGAFTFREILHAGDPLMGSFLDLYVSAFPETERSSITFHLRDLSDDYIPEPDRQLRRLIAVDEQGKLVGMARYTMRPISKLIYFTYFAIAGEARNRGLGSAFFKEVLRRSVLEIPDYEVIVWEVEDPDFVADSALNSDARRRLNFYERLGARTLLNANYTIQNEGQPAVPMRLMFLQGPVAREDDSGTRMLIRKFFDFTDV